MALPTRRRPHPLARIESLFDEFFGERGDIETYYKTAISPDTDIRETDKDIIIEAELPGLKKEDVSVIYENGALRISGEKKKERKEETENLHIVERRFGRFQRMIPMDESYIKPDGIKAEFHNGVLRVDVPKIEGKQPKQIEVSVE